MIALLSLLMVILFSIIFVRIGAVALEMTGLSREVATFQAQSAYTGVGFTTSESEYVVSHPVRRRIIRILMFVGSAGIASAMAMLFLSFVGKTMEESLYSLLYLAIGLVLLYAFARSKIVDRGLRYVIRKALKKFTRLHIYDYELLLGLSKGYSIGRFKIRKNSWLANKKLGDLRLSDEGVLVLGIIRRVKGRDVFLGTPRGDIEIHPGDELVCYGPDEIIKQLSHRLRGIRGDKEHRDAVEKEKIREMEEKMEIQG
ncbi:potassium transporter TrkA [Euryarchaeota archaeon ex4484_178]|nr:TrkA C-terminal domain-containing protein [Thermoplasmata archaeon]OYT59653.1 MAG: potassium transporter TrkA [Euryarchaeota archaeon ex4484_178]